MQTVEVSKNKAIIDVNNYFWLWFVIRFFMRINNKIMNNNLLNKTFLYTIVTITQINTYRLMANIKYLF